MRSRDYKAARQITAEMSFNCCFVQTASNSVVLFSSQIKVNLTGQWETKLLRSNCISQMCRGAVRALIGRRHNNWTCLKCSLKTWTHQQCHRFTLVKNVLKHSSPFSCQHMRVLFVLYVINKYIHMLHIRTTAHVWFCHCNNSPQRVFFSLFSHCRIFKSFFLRQHLPRLMLKYEGSNLNTEFIYCRLCMNEAAAENNLHIWLVFFVVFFSLFC